MKRREFLKTTGATLALAAAGGLPGRARAAADSFARLDALGQAELVRKGEVTPRELVEAAIARIEALDPKLNAVVTPLFERALTRARAGIAAGPFRGVPTLMKELTLYEEARLTYGSRFFAKNVAKLSHEFARRMEASGLVVLGMSNTPEFGLLPTTESAIHGPCHNPWNLTYSSGGSSGGAAAAVAAGLVPVAQASDGGGSIRIPASACGIFGLKPSRGRHPQRPTTGESGLSVYHVVSRSVRDSAAALDATQGAVAGDRWHAPAPERPFLKEVGAPPGRLRIAFSTKDFLGRSVHIDCESGVRDTARLCEKLGHEVVEKPAPVDGAAFNRAFILLWAQMASSIIQNATRALGRTPDRELFEPWTWALDAHAREYTPADVSAAWSTIHRIGYAVAAFQEEHDLLLGPVLGSPPLRLGAIDQSKPFDELVDQLTRYVGFTPLANALGVPAMSVPLHWNDAGLPIGMHFQARFGEEALLLRMAAQLEQARPWAERWPGTSAV